MLKTALSYGLALCLTVFWALCPVPARADDNKEYLVKAAFLYNFVKFVEWPGDLAIAGKSHIDICVLGSSPMSGTEAVFKQASTPKLGLSLVSEKSAGAAATHCHIAFIGRGASDALGTFKGKPVLTVGDGAEFAEQGGMVGFAMQDNKVKLIINKKAATDAGLRINAQLLEVALRVIDQ